MSRDVTYRLQLDAKGFAASAKEAEKQFDSFVKGMAEGSGQLGQLAAAAGPVGITLAAIGGAAVTAAVAVGGMVKGLVEAGGHLADLEAKTGISTQALQKLAFAGSLVGVSQDEITQSAVKMEKALANGDAVFGKLGLSAQKLRAMAPDEAFAAIATQIARIKDPAGQAAAAMEAFGKGGAAVLPLIKSDIAAATAEAERLGIVLSTKTVGAADALGDEATKLAAAWEGVKNQFAAAIVENPAILDGLKRIVGGVGDLSQWLIKNRDEIGSWGKSFITTIESVGAKLIALGNNPVVQFLNKAILKAIAYSTGGAFLGGDSGASAGSGTGHMAAGSSYAAIAGAHPSGLDFQGKEAVAAAEKAQAAWQTAAEKARAGWDKFYYDVDTLGKNALYSMQNDVDKYVDKVIKDVTRAGEQWIEALAKGRDAEAREMDYAAQVDEQLAASRRRHNEEFVNGLRAVADAVGGMGGAIGHFGAAAINIFANLKDKGLQSANVFQKVGMAIEGAIAAYKSGSVLGGAAAGAQAGAAFGFLGAGIGAVAGGILGLFGKNSKQKQELKDLNAQLATLEAQAAKAGIQLNIAFDPKNAKSLKTAIDQVNLALDTRAQAEQALNDAIQRYGFSEEELGPKLAGQKLDEQMGQIYQDWQLLTAAGVDHGAMLERIGPKVGELVDKYTTAGVEIPSSMKPIIDDLYEHHKLLHANGEEYTEAEKNALKYGETTSQMFTDLLKAVKDLVDALNGIPATKHTTVTVDTQYNGPRNFDGSPDYDGDPATPMASGGLVRARRGGKVVRLGEGGEDEFVVPRSKAAAFAASMGGGGSSGGSAVDTGMVAAEIRALRGDLRTTNQMLPKMIRDAVLLRP